MKKTLITLAALAASVASAATGTDATAYYTNPSTDRLSTGATSGAYTMVLVLDWDTVATTMGTWNTAGKVQVGYAGDQYSIWYNTGIGAWGTNETMYVSAQVDGSPVWGSSSLSGDNKDSLTLSSADFKDAAGNFTLAYTYDTATEDVALYALKNDGSLASLTGTSGKEWGNTNYGTMKINMPEGVVEKALVFNSVLSTSDIASIAAKPVPEPATATLSLLALAGLAARRRRK